MTIRTVEQIIDQMRSSLVDDNSELANFPQYGNLYAIYRSVAAVIKEQDTKIETVSSNLFLNTATGEALDAKAREFNIIRRVGTPSTGGIIILGNAQSIPANTILTDNQTGLQYTTIGRTVITSQRGVGSVESVEFTPLSNLEAGRELFSSLFPNLRFIVGTSFDPFLSSYRGDLVGGSYRETDTELRSRIIDTLGSLSSSTTQSLELAALNINGISRVAIEENNPGLGYITVYINNSQQSILNRVRRALNTVKPVGVALQVRAFENISIDVDLTITTFSNTSTVVLNNEIASSLQTYFNSISQNAVLTREALAGVILNIPEVVNVAITNPTDNIIINANEIATLNNVNITYN